MPQRIHPIDIKQLRQHNWIIKRLKSVLTAHLRSSKLPVAASPFKHIHTHMSIKLKIVLLCCQKQNSNNNNNECYRNHSHIITSLPFVFEFFFSLFWRFCFCRALFVGTAALITYTKWFIKISLRTRYMQIGVKFLANTKRAETYHSRINRHPKKMNEFVAPFIASGERQTR